MVGPESLGLRVGILLAGTAGAIGAVSCGNDASSNTESRPDMTIEAVDLANSTTSATTPESTSTTTTSPEDKAAASALIARIMNPLAETEDSQGFNQDFNCVATAKASNGAANVITLGGVEVVKEVLPRDRDVDIEFTDAFHLKWSSSISAPFTGDLTDTESIKEQIGLAGCAEPIFMGTFVYEFLNDGEIDGIPLYEHPNLPEFLKPFIGLDVNEITALLADPYDSPQGAEQEAANLKASQDRQTLSEWQVAMLNMLQHRYEENVRNIDNYELKIDSLVDPLRLPLVGPRPLYTGEEEVFGWEVKESEVCEVELEIRYNAGNNTEEGRGGDKSPRIELDIDCEPETPPGDTTPDKEPTNSTPRGGSGSGGTPDSGNPEDDGEDGYGSTTTTPGATTSSTGVPATVGTPTSVVQTGTVATNPGSDND